MQISGYNLNDFWSRDGRSIKPATWNMEHGTWNMEHGTWNMEHGTSRNIAEHRGTPNNDDSEEDM